MMPEKTEIYIRTGEMNMGEEIKQPYFVVLAAVNEHAARHRASP